MNHDQSITISIIIPIFNAEKFIGTCIKSILKQDITTFELILINDGSTDSSLNLCQEFALKDSRIVIINIKNSGVSSARNEGIKIAKGYWITFIDSDDFISDGYFNQLADAGNADLIILGMKKVFAESIVDIGKVTQGNFSRYEFLERFSIYFDFASPCAKFYQRKIISSNQIYFNEKVYFGEDAIFNLNYLRYCKNITAATMASYFYRNQSTGLSKTNCNYFKDQFLYNCIKEQLHFLPTQFYSKNIFYPLERMLVGLYNNNDLHAKEKERALKNIVNSDMEAILYLYKNLRIKYLFLFCNSINNYFLLNIALIYKSKNITANNRSN